MDAENLLVETRVVVVLYIRCINRVGGIGEMSGKGGNGRIDFGSLESGMELAHEIPRMLITEVVGIRAFMGGGESGFFPWRGPWRGWPRFVTVKISISVNLR